MKPVIRAEALSDGQMAACEVSGHEVLVCRVGGELYAVADRCSHARQRLSTGRLRGFEITCPLHGARFDVRDGRCLSPPANCPITTFAVTVEDGCVVVAGE